MYGVGVLSRKNVSIMKKYKDHKIVYLFTSITHNNISTYVLFNLNYDHTIHVTVTHKQFCLSVFYSYHINFVL